VTGRRARIGLVFAAVAAVMGSNAIAAGPGSDGEALPSPAAPTIFASPIHAGCKTSGARTCQIVVDPFTLNIAPGKQLAEFQIRVDNAIVYDFLPDLSNPPAAPTFTPSLVKLGFAVRCTSGRVVSLLGRDTGDASLFALGTTGPINCPSPTGNMGFTPVAPCRLFDSRNSTGPDAGAPSLAAAETRQVAVAGKCGIPSTAGAVSANVTVTNERSAGFLKLFPADETAPSTSSINFVAGRTRANSALLHLAIDASGFMVRNASAGTTDVIVDVNGYFE
jgi:hypothetical protein